MLVRGSSLAESLSSYLIDRIRERSNVEVLYDVEVSALAGGDALEQVRLRSLLTNTEETMPTRRLFVCIGGVPNTEWAKDTDIVRDRSGHLVTGPDLLDEGRPPACWPLDRQPYFLETSMPGSFAVGDVRHGSIRRVASAVGEGAMAVSFVHRHLEEAHASA